MILRHATPWTNVQSIDSLGLLPSKARGSIQRVWLHSPRLTHWGILHVARSHGVSPDEVRVLTVSVPKQWLIRQSPGLWYCERVIESGRIAGSPSWFAGVVVSMSGSINVTLDGPHALVDGQSANH